MARRFNTSKVRAAISRYNSAVSRYNSSVQQYNAKLRRAVSDHNRRVRQFNTQVRELQRQLASLQGLPQVRVYPQLVVELRTVVIYREYTLVVREQEWGLLDRSEQELLQEAAQEQGVELMLLDADGNEL